MESSRFAPGLLVALSLVWGSTWIANSMLADPSGPLRTTSLRYLLAALCLAVVWSCQTLIQRLRRAPPANPAASQPATPPKHDEASHPSQLPARAWLATGIVLGCTMFALPDLLFVWAARHGVAHFTPLIYAGLPLGLLLACGELRQPAILAVGAMLVLLNGSLPLIGSRLAWTILIAIAVSLQGWSLLHARRHLAAAASLRGIVVQLSTAAGLLEIALRLWPDPTAQTPLHNWPESSLGALLMLAIPATAVVYPLYYRLLTWLEPAQLATTFWLQMLVALGESAWLLRMRPSWMMTAAGVVLVACSILMLRKGPLDAEAGLRLSP